jgi:hypothetical protein
MDVFILIEPSSKRRRVDIIEAIPEVQGTIQGTL